MVLRLAGDLPILWRTPTSVQVGSDAVAVLEGVTDGEARLLAALAAGVSASGFEMIATAAGVPADRADALLDALRPALAAAVPRVGRVAVLGESPLARQVAGLFAAAGTLAPPEEAGLVVLVGAWVLAPADHAPWLNRDVPHVPVLVRERSVDVGPFVEPGAGPCLYCVHLARCDDDAAWPALATQLLGREGRELDAVTRVEVAAFVARRVGERLDGGRHPGVSWTLDDRGGVSERTWERHPDCRCAAPAGNGWATAHPRATRVVPTTG